MKKAVRKLSTAERRRQAQESLARIRVLVAQKGSPLAGLSEAEAIERIRSVREELWDQKFAARP